MFRFLRALGLLVWPLAIGAQLTNFGSSAGTANTETEPPFRILSAGPPANDAFSAALKVNAQPTWSHSTGNQSASMEAQEALLAHGGEPNAAASIWYTWTVRERAELLVDTAGSGFSTVIGVYRGNVLSDLTRVAGASSSVLGRDAWVRFTAEANISYKIAIAGGPSAPLGPVRVRFEVVGGEPDLALPVVEITRPASGETVRESRVRIEGAAFDPEPNGSGIREVQYTLSTEGDTIIRNAQGTTLFSATVDLQEGVNVVTFWANDNADNRSANRRFSLLLSPILSTNDLFFDRIVLDPRSQTRTDLSIGSTKEFLEPAHAGNPGGSSIWYEFAPVESGVLLLSTLGSGFDTVLGVYSSANLTFPTVTNLLELASNDDVGGGGGYSEVAVTVQGGRKYFIAIDGFDGQSGLVQLNYRFSPVRVYELTLLPSVGNGTVSPAGGIYPENATVSVTARPGPGQEFDYFETSSGQVRQNPLALVINGDISVRAVFRPRTFLEDFEDGIGLSFEGGWSLEFDPTNRLNHVFASFGNGANRVTNSVSLVLRVADGIGGFDFSTSTETNYDRLEFSVSYLLDGKESSPVSFGSWSGERRGRYEFALRSGTARLQWRYVKDSAITDGADVVFIDNLDLPLPVAQSSLQVTGNTVTVNISGLGTQAMRVEASRDLRSWTSIRTATPDADGEASFEEPVSEGLRFYRFIAVPLQGPPR